MKNIIIAGTSVYGLNNLSDDSMFIVFCRELHKNIPDLKLTLLARHPGRELDETYKLTSIKNLDHDSKEQSIGRWFMGLNSGDSTRHLKKIWNVIKECDLLIIGGDPFIDITIGVYKGLAPYASLLVTLAKFLEKPVMIQGIHMGRPLETEMGKELAKYCISNATLVTIREEQSRDLLKEMGIKADNVVTVADAAYGLDPVLDKTKGDEILKKESIHFKSDNVIGVTFRHMYWKWRFKEWNYYSNTVADICDYMVDKFKADLLFIPHCTYNIDHEYEDDRPAARDIVKKMQNKESAHRIINRLNVYETLALFPHLKMIFSNRRHSAIFGAIHGVPGMGVGEEAHVKPVMEQLCIGGDKFVSIENFDSDTIKKNLTDIWKDRENIKIKMKKSLPALREKALMNAKLASDLIY